MNTPNKSSADDTPYAMTREQTAGFMMKMLQRYTLLCHQGEKAPDVSLLQQGMNVLHPDIAEQVGSEQRFAFIEAIEAKQPTETWVQKALARLFGRTAQHVALQDNLEWLRSHGDPASPTMLATHADIAMAVGSRDEARETYRRALRAAQEGGHTITE